MISFPSSFSKGGSSFYSVGKTTFPTLPNPDDTPFENVQTKNLKLTDSIIDYIYKNDNRFGDFDGYHGNHKVYKSGTNNIYFEDPFKSSIYALRGMNMYQFTYSNAVKNLFDAYTDGKAEGENGRQNVNIVMTETAGSPALFNPAMAINTIGVTQNVPLLNSNISQQSHNQIKDPTIANLIAGSKNLTGTLGNARYSLIDFIYCKDLGKVPNNRLITLRRFAQPVGDHIYKWSTSRVASEFEGMMGAPDIGRLIAWFDTDDNKLENICKYETKLEWRQLKSEIQEIDSKEEDSNRGILGRIHNTMNPSYNDRVNLTGTNGHSLWGHLGTKLSTKFNFLGNHSNESDAVAAMRMSSDQNRVYEPLNTVRDTHIYGGKLELNQDINITFSYVLRAYENINPKSAFLDLIGNILEVTYQRGRFWGGSRRFLGPPQNQSGWKKSEALINNAFDKIGGFIGAVGSGQFDWSNFMGSISNLIGGALSKSYEGLKNLGDKISTQGLAETAKEIGEAGVQGAQKLDQKYHLSSGLKGMLKNSLGRPAIYAMHSLLSGDDCGFWHLTIGNPFNPIMCIGNLILETATITHSGPLGIDDFPSEIKVTVSLKPGRSRDSAEIQRYYTQGLGSIYMPKNKDYISKYHNGVSGSEISDVELAKMEQEAHKNANAIVNSDENTDISSINTSTKLQDQYESKVIESSINSMGDEDNVNILTQGQGTQMMIGTSNLYQRQLMTDGTSA